MARLAPIPVKYVFLPIILGVLLQISGEANGQVYEVLEKLRPGQRQSLAEFKKIVSTMLPHDWMKEDIYLWKFMSFNLFKISKSVAHLKEMLQWRRDNNVDEELRISPNGPSKNYADLQIDYPVYNDGYDKEGRPICEAPFGAWDLRKAAASGNTKRLIAHHLINCYERAEVRIREQQARGKNVTQWVYLANMDHFSVATHLCPACAPVSVAMTAGIDKYFPQSPKGFWLPNTPDHFALLLNLVRPVLSQATRLAIKPLTADENSWKRFLEKRVDFDQISSWYGGPKERH